MNDKGQMEKTVNNIDFPSSCLERMRLFVLFVGLLIFVPVDAAAISKCRQAVGMAELFATSDLVAVVRYTRRNVRGRPLGVLSQGQAVRVESLNVSFVELLKKPYVTGFDQSTSQLIYLTPYLLKENEPVRAVAFLQYRGENRWVVPRCGLLPIDSAGRVLEACDSIKDIFGNDRFKRESRCLLSTPAFVSLGEIKKEIERVKMHAHHYSGYADVVEVSRWEQNQAFQRVMLRFRGRAIKKVISQTYRGGDLQAMAYYPTELLKNERSYVQKFKKGRRLKIEATWYEGNLVIDSLSK